MTILECTCHIVSYLADVTNALSQSSGQGPSHLSVDGEERAIEVDSDWVEELAVEEEDSQAEDSVGSGHRECCKGQEGLFCTSQITQFTNGDFVFIPDERLSEGPCMAGLSFLPRCVGSVISIEVKYLLF